MSNLWPSGDWGDSYEEGMRKLGIEFDDDEELEEDAELNENEGDEE